MKEAGRESKHTPTVPQSVDHLLLINALSHLKATAHEYSMVTIPMLPVADSVQIVTSSIEEKLFADDLDSADVELQEREDRRELVRSAAPAEVDLPNKRRRLMHKQAIVAVAEVQSKHQQEQAANFLCLRVLKMNPGRIKTITTFTPKGGRVLAQDDLAVTIRRYDL